MSHVTLVTAGVLLLCVVTIEYGGLFLLSIHRGKAPLTDFQKAFFRAGHAHAGVLVILSLVMLPYCDAAGVGGLLAAIARYGVPLAAILMPMGFFFAAIGPGLEKPNGLLPLVYVGAASLAGGVLCLGIGLILKAF